MFVKIWTNSKFKIDENSVKYIFINKIVCIRQHSGYNSCVVVTDCGVEYAHHESAEKLIARIKEIKNAN